VCLAVGKCGPLSRQSGGNLTCYPDVGSCSRRRPMKGCANAFCTGFARRDVVPGNLAIVGPLQDGIRGRVGAIVAHEAAMTALAKSSAVRIIGSSGLPPTEEGRRWIFSSEEWGQT
jgi:hypothetical protein